MYTLYTFLIEQTFTTKMKITIDVGYVMLYLNIPRINEAENYGQYGQYP